MLDAEINERCFVDTNIWLYAFVEAQDRLKHSLAKAVVQRTGVVLSTQVVNETCFNLLKKANSSETEIQRLIASFYAKYKVVPTERFAMQKGSNLRKRYGFSYWDSLVVACALLAECTVLYSEDMQTGLRVEDQTTIVNPFSDALRPA
ncbi:MAG: PIN domain-containing protein [Synergistaceae bacterium]|nr:PIN domain-containing protein [Synergistota bacterium]NLM72360.1 PIN domain-containing protein [Synergistaceae bacterium]